jgi:hypothetical protein
VEGLGRIQAGQVVKPVKVDLVSTADP